MDTPRTQSLKDLRAKRLAYYNPISDNSPGVEKEGNLVESQTISKQNDSKGADENINGSFVESVKINSQITKNRFDDYTIEKDEILSNEMSTVNDESQLENVLGKDRFKRLLKNLESCNLSLEEYGINSDENHQNSSSICDFVYEDKEQYDKIPPSPFDSFTNHVKIVNEENNSFFSSSEKDHFLSQEYSDSQFKSNISNNADDAYNSFVSVTNDMDRILDDQNLNQHKSHSEDNHAVNSKYFTLSDSSHISQNEMPENNFVNNHDSSIKEPTLTARLKRFGIEKKFGNLIPLNNPELEILSNCENDVAMKTPSFADYSFDTLNKINTSPVSEYKKYSTINTDSSVKNYCENDVHLKKPPQSEYSLNTLHKSSISELNLNQKDKSLVTEYTKYPTSNIDSSLKNYYENDVNIEKSPYSDLQKSSISESNINQKYKPFATEYEKYSTLNADSSVRNHQFFDECGDFSKSVNHSHTKNHAHREYPKDDITNVDFRICSDCGAKNKAFLSWCIDCGFALNGEDVISLDKKGLNEKQYGIDSNHSEQYKKNTEDKLSIDNLISHNDVVRREIASGSHESLSEDLKNELSISLEDSYSSMALHKAKNGNPEHQYNNHAETCDLEYQDLKILKCVLPNNLRNELSIDVRRSVDSISSNRKSKNSTQKAIKNTHLSKKGSTLKSKQILKASNHQLDSCNFDYPDTPTDRIFDNEDQNNLYIESAERNSSNFDDNSCGPTMRSNEFETMHVNNLTFDSQEPKKILINKKSKRTKENHQQKWATTSSSKNTYTPSSKYISRPHSASIYKQDKEVNLKDKNIYFRPSTGGKRTPLPRVAQMSSSSGISKILRDKFSEDSSMKFIYQDFDKQLKLRYPKDILATYDKYNEMSPRVQSGSFPLWLCLPEEIWMHIFSFLSQYQLKICSRVCRSFNRISQDKAFWNHIKLKKRHNISDKWLSEIGAKMPSILELDNCKSNLVTKNGLRDLFRQCGDSLKGLNITGCHGRYLTGEEILFHAATRCRGIRFLNISWCDVSDNGINAMFEACLKLESVCLNGCQNLTDDTIKSLTARHGSWLHTLEVAHCFNLTKNAVQFIKMSCPNLTKLNFSQCWKLTNHSLCQLFQNLKLLKYLYLSGCTEIEDSCIEELTEHCRQLKHLAIANCPNVTDACLRKIGKNCPQLQTFDIHGCKISDRGINSIAWYCRNLKTLDISSTRITSEGILQIGKYCNQDLEVMKANFCNNITQDSILRLVNRCPKMQKLFVYGVKGIKHTLDMMKLRPDLQLETQ